MSEQEHIQKKPLATDLNQSEHNGFATRGFAEQLEQDVASKQQSQDFKTQLSRAERFGHNLSKMPVPTSPLPMATLQTKAPASAAGNQAIQREAMPEEEELQMKSENPAQLATQNQKVLPVQHSTEPVRDTGFGSVLDEIRSIDDPTMDLNAYKSLNQHVESLLPQLQQQMTSQSAPGDMQNTMQLAKGGGGMKGGGMKGMMSKMMGK